MSAPPSKKAKSTMDLSTQHPQLPAMDKPDDERWKQLYPEQKSVYNEGTIERDRRRKYDKKKKKKKGERKI